MTLSDESLPGNGICAGNVSQQSLWNPKQGLLVDLPVFTQQISLEPIKPPYWGVPFSGSPCLLVFGTGSLQEDRSHFEASSLFSPANHQAHPTNEVSLNAFHVDVGEKAASAGSSTIRAALAGGAVSGGVLGKSFHEPRKREAATIRSPKFWIPRARCELPLGVPCKNHQTSRCACGCTL